MDALEVTGVGSIRREPSPVLLTKQLVLVFTLSGGLDRQVTSMAGALPGVYPSVYLSTDQPSVQSLNESLVTSTRFAVPGRDVERSVRIGLLGLHDPDYGRTYTGHLALTLYLNDDSPEKTMVDLTGVLSGIIEDNRGVFPPLAYIAIELTRTEVGGIGVSITDWGSGEDETIEL
jgi:hypothetical protein